MACSSLTKCVNQPCNGVSSNGKTCSKSKEPFSENTFIYRQISYKFTSLSVHAEQIVVALPGGGKKPYREKGIVGFTAF